jgi:hypothetical protein
VVTQKEKISESRLDRTYLQITIIKYKR